MNSYIFTVINVVATLLLIIPRVRDKLVLSGWKRERFSVCSERGYFKCLWNKQRILKNKYELLHKKVKNNNLSFIQNAFEHLFVDHDDKCTFENTTLLERALVYSNVQTLDFLIAHYGTDIFIGYEGQNMFSIILRRLANPSFQASRSINDLFIKLFKVSNVPKNAFVLALDKLPLKTCKLILKTGHSRQYLDTLHYNKMTPLHIAVDTECLGKINMLIAYQAPVHRWKKILPSEYAILKDSSLDMIDSLIKYESNLGFELSTIFKNVLAILHDPNRQHDKPGRSILKDIISFGTDFRPCFEMVSSRIISETTLSFQYDPELPPSLTSMAVSELLGKARHFHSEANEILECVNRFLEYISQHMEEVSVKIQRYGHQMSLITFALFPRTMLS